MFRPLAAAALLLAGAAGLPAQELPPPVGVVSTNEVPAAAPLKIGGGGARLGEPAGAAAEPRGSSVWGVAGSLALVLGLFAACAKWFGGSKLRGAVAGGGPCEVLSRVKLEPRASVHLLRVGSRVLVVGSAADGLSSLGEIDDPVEAEALIAACRAESGGTAAASFGRESFRTLFGRAAAASSDGTEPPATVPLRAEPAADPTSAAERRLAARLRPAGVGR